jgi:hypothetical protein
MRILSTCLTLLHLVAVPGCSSDSAESEAVATGSDIPTVASDIDVASDTEVSAGDTPPPRKTAIEVALGALSFARMKLDVDLLAADELGGRITGSVGAKIAREHIANEMAAMGLQPLGDDDTYFHEYEAPPPAEPRYELNADLSVSLSTATDGVNIIGMLPGTDPILANEYIVYLAHYDHLGVTKKGESFNGAFDDVGGVAVGLEVARAMIEANAAPKRSIIFLISDGEERGLQGAEMWLAKPTIPRENIVFAISGDPLGRRHLPDYSVIGLSGAERSPGLLEFLRTTTDYVESDVVFLNRELIPLFASDQDRFYDLGIPAVWFVNIGFSWYHTIDDDPQTVDYRMLLDDARWLLQTLHAGGERDDRFTYDGPKPFDVQTARDVREFVVGILTSKELDENERTRAVALLAQLDTVIETGSYDAIGDLEVFVTTTLFFLVFELTGAHPGEVPPPLPGDP